LALSSLPDIAVCDSFETTQAERSDSKPTGNDAVRLIETRYKNETDKYDKAFEDFEKSAALDKPFGYNLSRLDQFLQSQMTAGNDAEARQTAAVLLVTLAGYQVAIPSSLYKQVLQLVPPDSEAWGKEDEVIEYESEGLDSEGAKKFLEEIVNHNPDRHVQARAQTAQVKLASRQHDIQLSRAVRWIEQDADLMASVLRNLIELKFWAKFVSESPAKATQFLSEATIDARELFDRLKKNGTA
jgi:tetratricopeptide (TPR) repeat protein